MGVSNKNRGSSLFFMGVPVNLPICNSEEPKQKMINVLKPFTGKPGG